MWKYRPATRSRSSSERTSSSGSLSQKHTVEHRRAVTVTAQHSFPAIVSGKGERCLTLLDSRTIERERRLVEGGLSHETNTMIGLSEGGRLSVRGTSCRRTVSRVHQRQKEMWPLSLREDAVLVDRTDVQKLYAELRMAIKLHPFPIVGQLKPLCR